MSQKVLKKYFFQRRKSPCQEEEKEESEKKTVILENFQNSKVKILRLLQRILTSFPPPTHGDIASAKINCWGGGQRLPCDTAVTRR